MMAVGRRRRIGLDGPRPRPRLLEERLVALVRDDGDAFGDVLPQAARVVVVGVRVHDVADRLVRYRLADESLTTFDRASLVGPSSITM